MQTILIQNNFLTYKIDNQSNLNIIYKLFTISSILKKN